MNCGLFLRGYVNHPQDPGGMTNLGVTKRTYDHYYNTDIDEDGMRQLNKTDVEPIYHDNYWLKCQCHRLPSGVDWSVFDFAVNSGTRRASKLLQRAVRALEDGIIGSNTLAKVDMFPAEDIINEIALYREQFYRSLGTFDTFWRGWLKRNEQTRQQALDMAD